MEWFPIAAGTFKVVALGTGMFFAIKWHYDQGKKGKARETRAVLRTSGIVAVAFLAVLVGLGMLTFALGTRLGLDLRMP
jgi:hypothetical protein